MSFGEFIERVRRSAAAIYALAMLIVIFIDLPLKAQAIFDEQPIFFWLASFLSGTLFILLARWGTRADARASETRSVQAVLFGLAAGVALLGWLLLADWGLGRTFPALYSRYTSSRQFAGPGVLLTAVAGVGLVLPIGEETLFRGYLQGRLGQRYGPAIGLLLASLLYGVRALDPFVFLSNLGTGLILGWLAQRAGVRAAIVAHIAAALGLLAYTFIVA